MDEIDRAQKPGEIGASCGEMDDSSQLVLGTLMLDGTDNVVTQDLAERLLPLWQLYQTMSAEDTIASGELEANSNQIENFLRRNNRP